MTDEGRGYSVLLREEQDWNFMEVSRVLQEEAGLSMADATRAAKRRPGIMAQSLHVSDAKALVRALRAIGVACFLIPDDQLLDGPDPIHVDAAQLGRAGIEVVVSGTFGGDAGFSWNDLEYLATARIDGSSPGGDVFTARKRTGGGSLTQRKQVMGFTPQVKRSAFVALLLWFGPLGPGQRLLLFDSANFDFGCLGDHATINRPQNMALLTRVIAHRCPGATLSPGAREVVEGDAPVSLRFPHLVEFRTDLLWRVNLLLLARKAGEA